MSGHDEQIMAADRQGNLNRAVALASQQIVQISMEVDLEQRARRYIRFSWMLRHRGLGDDLSRSRDAAAQAVRLASLPTADPALLPLAKLALASSRLALGDEAGCRDIAEAYVRPGDHAMPEVASWAWRLLGQAALTQNSVFDAVAALLNAVAEEQRLAQPTCADATRVLLLQAFSRAGHVLDAEKVIRNTVPGQMPTRRWAAFLLARAEHERRFGDIKGALETLGDAETLLLQGSGLNRLRARLHRLRASCLDDWRLVEEAHGQRQLAKKLETWDLPTALPKQLVSTLPRQQSRYSPVSLSGGRCPERPIFELVKEFSSLQPLETRHARSLECALARLHGVPGEDRTEALALVEAGSLLATGNPEVHRTAERLLRRALARLEYLEGSELWQARCRSALGRLLAPERPEEALNLLVEAVKGFSGQRHQMKKRSHRSTWRKAVEHPPFGAAIELAHSLKRDDLAADLIIHSRLSGIISPAEQHGGPTDTDRVEEVPLAQVPTLTYINGATSALGGAERCRLL
ncbi:MAG: hypothetical protein Q4B08_12080 [Propionibacteriaceae bacterium]|nr:hypothetical protein [Propionibacteriaceae bacterium]